MIKLDTILQINRALRRGSRINTDRFLKAQTSRGVLGLPPRKDFNSLKFPFLGFQVFQTGYGPVQFTLDDALQLGKIFIH